MEAFLKAAASRTTGAKTRFRIDRELSEAVGMLTGCYQMEVTNRGGVFQADPATTDHINKAALWLTGGTKVGLLLAGNCGNGKTTLTKAIKRMIDTLYYSSLSTARKTINYVSATELAGMARDDSSNFERLRKSEMLAIDDVGVEPASVKVYGNEISPFVELMYERYDKQLMTLVSTNLHMEDFQKRYGERIADRFREIFGVISFRNESYRRRQL